MQVLAPMVRGACGTRTLNQFLQRFFNTKPDARPYEHGEKRLFVGDRVIQTANNYDKGVFNGDVGVIAHLNNEARTLTVNFEGTGATEVVGYERSEIDQLDLAWSITVHKSQGTEYGAVVVPLHNQHSVLLSRHLLYTAVTRATRLVVLVGPESAVKYAVAHVKSSAENRNSLLHKRLRDELERSEEQARQWQSRVEHEEIEVLTAGKLFGL
jgi:exodeoxyribonuclease V alpha subunit